MWPLNDIIRVPTLDFFIREQKNNAYCMSVRLAIKRLRALFKHFHNHRRQVRILAVVRNNHNIFFNPSMYNDANLHRKTQKIFITRKHIFQHFIQI